MTDASVQARILARLDEAPDARCLAFLHPHEQTRWLSRAAFHRQVTGAAHALIGEDVAPRDVCVIVLPSGELAAIALAATLMRGAVPLLIAPPTLVGGHHEISATLSTTLRRTRARRAICASFLEPELAPLVQRFPGTRFLFLPSTWRGDEHTSPLAPVLPGTSDVAAMQLTSGTTASPRICVWDQRAVLAALDGMTAAMALRASDVCLNWTPLYHDMGLVNNFLLCLTRGTPLVLLSPQDFIRRPALWLRGLSDTGATITWSPNFGFAITTRKADDRELEGVRLERVRAFWNAAERIHYDTMEAFARRFAPWGVRREALKTNYGCAENVGGATFSALDAPPRHECVSRRLLDEAGMAHPVPAATREDADTVCIVSAGRPHPRLRARILSPSGRERPDGRVGEICLDTPSRMLRYHRNAHDTRRAMYGGLLHTGDLGYLRDGELFWVGRLRERITVQGKKIDPSAFEGLLATIPGLREGCFAAFGVPDERLGTDRVIVVSEVRPPMATVDTLAATIRRRCFLQLGLTPHDVVLVKPGVLTKTSSGKRRHRYVRTLYLAGDLECVRLRADEPVAAP